MTRTRHPARLAALAPFLLTGVMLLGIVPPATAQTDDVSQMTREQRRQAILDQVRQEQTATTLIALDFPGGTIADYIEAIKKAIEPVASNILVRGDAGAVPMGPAMLEGVPLANALRLLAGHSQDGPNAWFVEVNTLSSPQGRPAYAVHVKMAGSPFRGAGQTKILVLSLKEITTAFPGDPPEVVVHAETVLTAIETALAVAAGDGGEARVQYHEESGLLVMAGGSSALDSANQIVEAIADDIRTRRGRMRDLTRSQNLTNPDMLEERLADARVELEMAEVQMGRARTHMEITQQQIVEVEKRVKEGGASTNELREFHMRLSDTQTEMLERQIMAKRSAERVEQAEVKLARALEIVAGTGSPGGGAEALRKENEMLRERLAMLEARLAQITAELEANNARNSGGGRGGNR